MRRGGGMVWGLVPLDGVSLHCRNCADWAFLIDKPCLYSELSKVQEPCVTAAVFAKGGKAMAKQTFSFSPMEKVWELHMFTQSLQLSLRAFSHWLYVCSGLNQLMSWWTWWVLPLVGFLFTQKGMQVSMINKPDENVHFTHWSDVSGVGARR